MAGDLHTPTTCSDGALPAPVLPKLAARAGLAWLAISDHDTMLPVEYATKRYRSNLINWGMLPFQLDGPTPFGLGDYVLIPGARALLAENRLESIPAYVLGENGPTALRPPIAPPTADERQILPDGCPIHQSTPG